MALSQDLNVHETLTDPNGKSTVQAIVALGSNVAPAQGGSCADTIRAAMAALPAPGVRVLATSRLWETPCVPAGAGPDYVNAAALLDSDLSAEGLLDHLHAIEAPQIGQRQPQPVAAC